MIRGALLRAVNNRKVIVGGPNAIVAKDKQCVELAGGEATVDGKRKNILQPGDVVTFTAQYPFRVLDHTAFPRLTTLLHEACDYAPMHFVTQGDGDVMLQTTAIMKAKVDVRELPSFFELYLA